MEASALELRRGTAQGKGVLNGSLLRLRSDEQLVGLFRAGDDEAFRVIHDRYRKRLLAYMTQMLNGSVPDAEDALQDVFERAYFGLRAHHRELALRAWLYRVAHNRCVDQLRRPAPVAVIDPDETESRNLDPFTVTASREMLRRLIIDISRLPDHQRSALLLREMSGMSYAELGGALGVSVPAVKSLLVRARLGLAAAGEARDTACSVIREQLVAAHDGGTRPDATVRRHLRDCTQCRHFRRSMRSVSRNLAAVTPIVGPLGLVVKLLGGGGGAASGGMAGSGGGAAVGAGSLVSAGGAIGTTGALTGGVAAGGAGHVAAIVAAALMTAGGAVAVQPAAPSPHPPARSSATVSASSPPQLSSASGSGEAAGGATASAVAAPPGPAAGRGPSRPASAQSTQKASRPTPPGGAGRSTATSTAVPPGSATGSATQSPGEGSSGSTGLSGSTATVPAGSTAPAGSSTSSTGSTVTTSTAPSTTASTGGVTGTGTGGTTSAPSSSSSPPSSSSGSTSNG